ncbi:hypothetical protein FQZ97_1016980 [compost metagenome]
MSTVISTSAGDLAPSALTRSSRPSLTNTVLTLIPLSLVKASSRGWISLGSRVVYRLTSSAALADTVKAAAPASARARSSEFNWGRLVMTKGSG